jgi:lipopolysaccharide export system permease protein
MTYDRYLVKNFLHTFIVCFISTFGLFVVIDLFENLDEYIDLNNSISKALNTVPGTLSLLGIIGTLDGYRAVLFLDRGGPVLTVISVMTVLIVLQRTGELHPLLAAGIPMYRVLAPLIVAGASVNGILTFNQEFLVPRVAFLEHELRHRNDPSKSEVESVKDLSTNIMIDGAHVNVSSRTIEKPVFVLPRPSLVKELTDVEAETATFFPATGKNPSGWLLRKVSRPSIADLAERLTEEGRKIVLVRQSTNIFVTSEITCDQLFRRNSSYTSLSTLDLIDRIRCPAFGMVSVHRLVLYLHARFVQPLMNIIAVLIAVPLMVRRESPGLVADSSLCGFILAGLFGITQIFQYWGAIHFISPELAAWAPVVVGGSVSAWLSGLIRT